jgi:hypothetical protein
MKMYVTLNQLDEKEQLSFTLSTLKHRASGECSVLLVAEKPPLLDAAMDFNETGITDLSRILLEMKLGMFTVYATSVITVGTQQMTLDTTQRQRISSPMIQTQKQVWTI